ncbi:MAG: hypothetical protein KDA24_10020 [Deltaproteobacteria bacterium]|nr:hypothetical protein [Deltaproteobacteria bacterium]
MRRVWLLLVGLLLGGLAGCTAELTPCESELNCVILCECSNGGVGTSAGYACTQGTCRDGHINDRDCVRICGQVIPPPVDDDDATGDDDDGAGDDDSGDDDSGDDDSGDDDSAGAR